MKQLILIMILAGTACSSSSQLPEERVSPDSEPIQNIAVIPTNAIGLGYGNGAIISEAISVCVFNIIRDSRTYRLVERIDLDAILNEHSLQNVEITSQEQLSALGKIYNASLLLVSKAGSIGDSYYLSLKLLDVSTAKPIASVNESIPRTGTEKITEYLVPRTCQMLCKDIGEYEGEIIERSFLKRIFEFQF